MISKKIFILAFCSLLQPLLLSEALQEQKAVLRYSIDGTHLKNQSAREALLTFLKNTFQGYELVEFDFTNQSNADITIVPKKQIADDEVDAAATVSIKNVDGLQVSFEGIISQGFNKSVLFSIDNANQAALDRFKNAFEALPAVTYAVQATAPINVVQLKKAVTLFLTKEFPKCRLGESENAPRITFMATTLGETFAETKKAFVKVKLINSEGTALMLEDVSITEGEFATTISFDDAQDRQQFNRWKNDFIDSLLKNIRDNSPLPATAIKISFNGFGASKADRKIEDALTKYLEQLMAPQIVIKSSYTDDSVGIQIVRGMSAASQDHFSITARGSNGTLFGPFKGFYDSKTKKIVVTPEQHRQLQEWKMLNAGDTAKVGTIAPVVSQPDENKTDLLPSRKLIVSTDRTKNRKPTLDAYKNLLKELFPAFEIEFVQEKQAAVAPSVKILENAQGRTLFVFAPRSSDVAQVTIMLQGNTLKSTAAQPVFEISNANKNLIRLWAQEYFK